MDPTPLHEHLAHLVPEVFAHTGGDVAEVEAHAATGCSRCARALYNARDTTVELAAAEPPPAPRPALRQRLLASARASGALAARRGQKAPRFFDPAGELARLHIGAPGDDERTREIDELGAWVPAPDDTTERLLAQLQRLTGFPLLFVSILRGPRSGFRVQRGYSATGDRRRETSFCTHTVSTGAPLVIPNAAEEPFFRGSVLVVRDGVKAYAGVPLRTSRGIAIGTVCVMDYAPRRIHGTVVRALDLYAQPIAAEIERVRLAPEDRWPRTAAGAPLHPAGWFGAACALSVAPGLLPDPPALLVASGPDAEALADVAAGDEPVGRISPELADELGIDRPEGGAPLAGLLLARSPDVGERLAQIREAASSRALSIVVSRSEGLAKLSR